MSFKASSQSNSIQINSLQDLLKNWQDINSSFSILLLEKFNENSTEISTFTEKITSLIEKFVRVSKNINFQASDLKKDSKKKKKMEDFTNKMLNCVLENGKIIMDPSFFEIKSLVGQKIQSVSNILLKINAYGALLNLVLKSECEFGVYKSEISKNFHTFVLNFLICIFTEKNIFQINYFKLIADTLSQNIATNYPTILYKSFKYSLMKSLIYSNRDLSFLEFCEVFLFKLIKENEYYKGVPEHLLGVLQGFFKIMPQEYLLDLHIALKQANYQADINVNIDKLFFLNCGDQIRLKIIESYGVQKPEECVVFFEVLKPLFFNDLLHYKLKSYFSFEKLTEKDHLNLSNELKKALVNFFETSIKKQFELQIQIISKGNFEKNLISNNFEALIQIITSFMLNEQITKELDFELMDFLISLEKTYRALIPLGIWQNTVNIIIKSLFEILVVRNKSQELKFQETFKLFSIVAKDNSIEGLVNLSKFLRILSFASVPSTYKNQVLFYFNIYFF